MCTVVPSARVTMFAISATAHSSPKWSGCRSIRGIVPPFGSWDFSRAETWESECCFIAIMTVGAQVRQGSAGMLGKQPSTFPLPMHKLATRPTLRIVLQGPLPPDLLEVDPVDRSSCGGLGLTLGLGPIFHLWDKEHKRERFRPPEGICSILMAGS